MIPPADTRLDPTTSARSALTRQAAALVAAGVPADLVMLDAREGCDLAATQPARGADATTEALRQREARLVDLQRWHAAHTRRSAEPVEEADHG